MCTRKEPVNTVKPPALNFYRIEKSLILFSIFFFMLIGRWYSITYPLPLNPDEAQMGANVLRGMQHGFNWGGMDGTTSGPLNSLILAWPKFFGFDVTLSTIRITALLLITLVVFFLYMSIRLFLNAKISASLCLPLTSFYALTNNREFLHYSSELLPMALISLVIYMLFRAVKFRNWALPSIFSIGLFLACVPFAKLQATPIAFAVALFAFLSALIFSHNRFNVIGWLIFGASIMPILFFLPLIYSNQFVDF